MKTDWISFQILSVNADGSFGREHNFVPEYEVSYDGQDKVTVQIKGKPTGTYEEIDMNLAKSLYFSSFEMKVSTDYITFTFKTKTTVKLKVVAYFLNFIDF